MNVVKITVLKRAVHQELARAIRGADVAPCEQFADGQVFYAGLAAPDGFCPWAWQDVSRVALALQTGGRFDQGMFQGWMRDADTVVSCCTDGFRPVTFKLERVERASLIDLAGVERPAPAAAYDSERYGAFSYCFTGLEPGTPHRVRLHFCEVFHSGASKRRFAVESGAQRLLEEFDVFAEAGGAFRPIVREFDLIADAGGAISLRFVKGSADLPKVSVIEIAQAGTGKVLHAVNAGGGACGALSADRFFSGGAVSGG